MKIFLMGTGNMAQTTLQKIKEVPSCIEILGFIDNNSNLRTK